MSGRRTTLARSDHRRESVRATSTGVSLRERKTYDGATGELTRVTRSVWRYDWPLTVRAIGTGQPLLVRLDPLLTRCPRRRTLFAPNTKDGRRNRTRMHDCL